jgi:hypothetical protein
MIFSCGGGKKFCFKLKLKCPFESGINGWGFDSEKSLITFAYVLLCESVGVCEEIVSHKLIKFETILIYCSNFNFSLKISKKRHFKNLTHINCKRTPNLDFRPIWKSA